MKTLFVLGRQPKIGLAELESLYGPDRLTAVGSSLASIDDSPEKVNFIRLGGTIKLCRILAEFKTDQSPLESRLRQYIVEELLALHYAKVNFGLSTHENTSLGSNQLKRLGLSIKQELKNKYAQPSRLIISQSNTLNAAQIIHNGLAGSKGYEFVVAETNSSTIIAATVQVQDIDSYSLRDYGRPRRDMRIGMLPPKLAQIIINLSVGNNEKRNLILLDPFCGTGVILQEGILAGFGVYGSDLNPQMIEYTSDNLKWLIEKYGLTSSKVKVELADATSHQWNGSFDALASEVYLGRAYSSPPSPGNLSNNISDTNTIIEKFLINLSPQLPSGFRCCLALPAWIGSNDKLHRLPLLDHLEKLGYNRLSFEHVKDEELIYYRPAQFVGRELLVIVKR
jgi:tRNA G10  N-methylase Trm11